LNELNADTGALGNALQVEISRCMAGQGLVYYPQTQIVSSISSGPSEVPSSLIVAETDGYGLYNEAVLKAAQPQVSPDAPNDAEQRYQASLTGQALTKYLRALSGPSNAVLKTYNVPGLGSFQVVPAGCTAKSTLRVYGNFPNSELIGNADGRLLLVWDAKQQQDGRLESLNLAWRRCMQGHGVAALSTPDNTWNALDEKYFYGATAELHALEIKTAVVDFECEATTHYVSLAESYEGEDAAKAETTEDSYVLRAEQAVKSSLKNLDTYHLPK
jgi:hypothetical protein